MWGMRGSVAVTAVIVGVIDEAAPEMIVPDAIDDRAPHQRIVGIGDPVRECGSPRPFIIGIDEFEIGINSFNTGKTAGLHEGATLFNIATMQNVNRPRSVRRDGVNRSGRGEGLQLLNYRR